MGTTNDKRFSAHGNFAVEGLRSYAAESGDLPLTHACDVWLGDEDPILTEEDWAETYGETYAGRCSSADDRLAVMQIRTAEDAARIIETALDDAAQAMIDWHIADLDRLEASMRERAVKQTA